MSDMTLSCPAPIRRYPNIVMAHGGGGRLMRDLIQGVFVQAFGPEPEVPLHDAALLASPPGNLAFTTDAYVVRPLFFPGGSIGTLAVNGTVNDLAMAGAEPLALSVAFVLEEGLPVETLLRVVEDMRTVAATIPVRVVTGDTKVVERGKCDGMYVTTAGVGRPLFESVIGPDRVQAGDAVLISGDIARHGIAVLASREGFTFEVEIESDCAPVWDAVRALAKAGLEVHCLRDLTRGGLASALVEIAEASRATIVIEDELIPVAQPVQAACELLGFDPLHVANEGRFVAFVPPDQADRALAALRDCPVSSGAVAIGRVTADAPGNVLLETVGGLRPVDMLSGELLPRIC